MNKKYELNDNKILTGKKYNIRLEFLGNIADDYINGYSENSSLKVITSEQNIKNILDCYNTNFLPEIKGNMLQNPIDNIEEEDCFIDVHKIVSGKMASIMWVLPIRQFEDELNNQGHQLLNEKRLLYLNATFAIHTMLSFFSKHYEYLKENRYKGQKSTFDIGKYYSLEDEKVYNEFIFLLVEVWNLHNMNFPSFPISQYAYFVEKKLISFFN